MKRILSMLFIGAVLATACASPAFAQKKETAKKEVARKEPPPAPQAQGTTREMLSQYVGKVTNLGTLKKVTAEYFVLDQDGSTVMHPLSVLHTVKVMKEEETGEMRIEIILVGKD